MSTAAETGATTAAPASLASSIAFRSFATVFAIATPVIYTICEMRNWPLFTYHPGTNRVDLFWAAAVRDEGPAMYWYGWTLTTVIVAGILGLIAAKLPESAVKRIPLSLTWITSLAAIPVLIYALRFFWRW
jgi:hypothetical protein